VFFSIVTHKNARFTDFLSFQNVPADSTKHSKKKSLDFKEKAQLG